MTFRRRALALAVAGALACGLTGCVAAPEAKPSTPAPAFTSDAAAYKAAEQVYRDYVDALNQVDLADPKTFEPVFALSSGNALAADKKTLSAQHAERLTKDGAAVVAAVDGVAVTSDRGDVRLNVCLDVSSVDVRDESGASRISPDRPSVQALTVLVRKDGSHTTVAGIGARDDGVSCG